MSAPYTYQVVWPILDDTLTLPQLAEEAAPEMTRTAGLAGAELTGPPRFVIGSGATGPVLIGRAPARMRPTGTLVKRRPRPLEPHPELPEEPIARTPKPRAPRTVKVLTQPPPKPPKKPRAGAAECGTDGGYYRHTRTTKTAPCEACRAAHSKAEADRRAYRVAVQAWEAQQQASAA